MVKRAGVGHVLPGNWFNPVRVLNPEALLNGPGPTFRAPTRGGEKAPEARVPGPRFGVVSENTLM